MGELIDLTLTGTTFSNIIDGLEKLCEISDDYFEIENYFCIIQNLNSQKRKYIGKVNEELIKEFGLE